MANTSDSSNNTETQFAFDRPPNRQARHVVVVIYTEGVHGPCSHSNIVVRVGSFITIIRFSNSHIKDPQAVIYPGALGREDTLNRTVKLKELSVVTAVHRFPNTPLTVGSPERDWDWRSDVVIKNADGAQFADVCVYRKCAVDSGDNLLCALQAKKQVDALPYDLIRKEHQKNKTAVQNVPEKSTLDEQEIKKAVVITVLVTTADQSRHHIGHNAPGASFADDFVYRENADAKSPGILCALQAKKVAKLPAHALAEEHTKNKTAIKNVPKASKLDKDGGIKGVRAITILITTADAEQVAEDFRKTSYPEDCLLIHRRNFAEFFGETFSVSAALAATSDRNVNFTTREHLKKKHKLKDEVVDQCNKYASPSTALLTYHRAAHPTRI
ncbi:hypothetical protein B0O80DRAFT_514604 [Mortierella sp. GBAus27b]|nr:hypothetical protein B0O80DRAFT_514604 [Mortierella sp. GBAus27b]